MLAFIDESGDHNLELEKIDHVYDMFVLGSVVFTESEYDIFDQKLNDLKLKFFGTTDIVLHTVEMNRPLKSKNRLYDKFKDADFRKSFYSDINELILQTDFKVVVCCIKKKLFRLTSESDLKDPYMYSLA